MSKIAQDLAKRALNGIEVIPFESFALEKYGSLTAKHHFSFGQYYDPKRVRHGLLRVFDDGIISSTKGLPFHPHRNIDIISVVLHKNKHPLTNKHEGGAGLVHEDTAGNTDIVRPGNVQVMSVGHVGLKHAELITDSGDSANVFQIWLNQARRKEENSYTKVTRPSKKGELVVLATGFPDGEQNGPPLFESKSCIASVLLDPQQSISYEIGSDRLGYVVPASGIIEINGIRVKAHDAAQISNTSRLQIKSVGEELAEIILVDVPPK